MPTTYSLKNISLVRNRRIFFDANVVLYIFWPTGVQKWERYYSSAFGALIQQQNELVLNYLVISEVINRAIRIEYEKHRINNLDQQILSFKNYRDSAGGTEALNDIYLIVKDTILPRFSISGRPFSKVDLDSFLTVEPLDFTDKAIRLLCRENNYVLITNDKDFKNSDIDILTSNPNLL